MADLTINSVPDEHRGKLQQLARDERERLADRVPTSPQTKDGGSKLERVRAFVAGHEGVPLTPEFIEEAINTGRP
jgi:hypothetical protein